MIVNIFLKDGVDLNAREVDLFTILYARKNFCDVPFLPVHFSKNLVIQSIKTDCDPV